MTDGRTCSNSFAGTDWEPVSEDRTAVLDRHPHPCQNPRADLFVVSLWMVAHTSEARGRSLETHVARASTRHAVARSLPGRQSGFEAFLVMRPIRLTFRKGFR